MRNAPDASAMASNERQKSAKPTVFRHRFYRRYSAFAAGTQFHGFGQIVESGNWFEQIIWLLVLVVCVLLTIKDVTKSFQEYAAGETISTTTINHTKNILFPNTSVCVDIEDRRFRFGGLFDAKNITQVRRFLRENLDAFVCSGFLAAENMTKKCDYYMEGARNEATLNAAVQLTSLLIMTLTNAEGSLFSAAPNASSFVRLTSYPEAVREMYAFYTSGQRAIDWGYLKQKTSQVLCTHLFVMENALSRLYSDEGEEPRQQDYQICPAGGHYWLGQAPFSYRLRGQSKLCVLLDRDVFSFDATTRVVFFLNPSQLYYRVAKGELSNAKVSFNVDASSVAGIAESELTSCVNLQLTNRQGEPAEIARSILVQGEYKAYSGDGDDACSDDAVPLDCKAQARSDEMEYFCACRSLSWSSLLTSNASLPFCATTFFASEREHKECSTKMLTRNMSWDGIDCVRNCRKTVVAYMLDEPSNDFVVFAKQLLSKGTSFISFTATGFEHPFVEESLKLPLSELFANLGGNMGLWLGGSFISLLHLFVFPMRIWLCGKRIAAADDEAAVSRSPRRLSQWEQTFDDIELPDLRPASVKKRKKDSLLESAAEKSDGNGGSTLEAKASA